MSFINSLRDLAVITLLVSSAVLSGCGKKDESNKDNKVATVPTSQQCLQQPQQTGWNTGYYTNTFQPYQYNNNTNCGTGYIPACNPNGGGMQCVRTTDIHNMGYSPVFYSWNPYMNNYAYSGYYGYGSANWSFYVSYNNGYYYPNQVAQICDVNFNTCGYGYCRPLNYGHSTGICVR
jgi:hypothetical protein